MLNTILGTISYIYNFFFLREALWLVAIIYTFGAIYLVFESYKEFKEIETNNMDYH